METELPSYVKLIKRDNLGFDFGAWSDGLFKDDLYKNYDNFIFVKLICDWSILSTLLLRVTGLTFTLVV